MKDKIHHQKKDRKALVMSIFIAFIMVTSAFGVIFYGFTDSNPNLEYGKHKFKVSQNRLMLTLDKQKYYFNTMPQDVEALETDKGVQAMIQNAYGIIITSEFNTTYKEEIAYAEYNMGNDLDNKGKLYFYGFTTQNDKLPVITCLNASKDIPVITIAEGNLSEARIEGNCINVQFNSSTNLVRLTEKIRFLFLGVINE